MLAALAGPASAHAEVPLTAFSEFNDVYNVKISPDGTYVAAEIYTGDGTGLAIIPLADPKKLIKIVPSYDVLADYWWSGPDRVVISIGRQVGSLEAPVPTGELVTAKAEDGHISYLFGYRGSTDAGRVKRIEATDASADVIAAPIKGDPDHVAVSVLPWDFATTEEAREETYRLNVTDGMLSNEQAAPAAGIFDYLTDWAGLVRYAVGVDERFRRLVFRHPSGDGDWKQVNTGDLKNARIEPVQMSPDGSKAYLISDEGKDRLCAVEDNLTTGQRRALSCDGEADVDQLVFSFDGKEPIAAFYQSDRPSLRLLDTTNPDKDKLAALEKAFPGQVAIPVSATEDGSKAVVMVYSDRNPGDYYIFETKTMHAQYLFPARQTVYADDMAERRPIKFKGRGGQMLHGYLTLPRGKDAKNLPLVVYPHGGPFRIADTWGWDADAEMLAGRGYAVLQVNFRGSAGYGEAFIEAGYNSWDSVMIDDITDAARWTIAQGFADPKRMCIYGASYGGYAALMSAEREPDLYRCAIGYAGIYDLTTWKRTSDVASRRSGQNYVHDYIGATTEALQKASPLNHLDKLRAALMLVHGEEDTRVPYSQAKALRAALDERHYPYEWLAKPGEGHGFYKPENRLEFYQKLLAFLDRNIQSRRRPAHHRRRRRRASASRRKALIPTAACEASQNCLPIRPLTGPVRDEPCGFRQRNFYQVPLPRRP